MALPSIDVAVSMAQQAGTQGISSGAAVAPPPPLPSSGFTASVSAGWGPIAIAALVLGLGGYFYFRG